MGGSAKAPKESDSQKKLAEEQAKLTEEQLKQAQKPAVIPDIKPPKPLPPPAPPASQSSQDVADASNDARRKALNRTNNARGTLFAGETGGYKAGLGGRKTLLG